MRRFLAIVIAAAPFYAHASQTTDYFTPKYWANFDWDNVEDSSIFNKPDYKDEKTTVETLAVYKKASVLVGGAPFSLYMTKVGDSYRFNLTANTEYKSLGQCEKESKKLADSFGGGFTFVDYTTFMHPTSGLALRSLQKNIGDTTVHTTCSAIVDKSYATSAPTILTLGFSKAEPIKKPFTLACDRTFLAPSQAPIPLNPMVMVIRESTKQIVTPDFDYVTNITSINDSEIKFSITVKDAKMDYTINRASGKLFALGTFGPSGENTSTVSGTCQLTTDAKKF